MMVCAGSSHLADPISTSLSAFGAARPSYGLTFSQGWAIVAIGIHPGPTVAATPHSYVLAIQVPDPRDVSLENIIAAITTHSHSYLPREDQIAQGMWNMWATPCYEPLTPTSNPCPWLYMPTFVPLSMPTWWDRPLPPASNDHQGYHTAFTAAQNRGAPQDLPQDTPLYCLYFLCEVRVVVSGQSHFLIAFSGAISSNWQCSSHHNAVCVGVDDHVSRIWPQ
jgi:hypothetical protein